ncbi:D-alanine--D-alanine ligase family protein [Solicola gregarius]|uniref:D-alanine--D-alanine ligase n=1 Tax=Solicola gregarius TaxID=2908642 RepID=A0AA46YKF2_9ACTN|nr:D-alanine--D-alanine ligase family protein [Solicola gregarius]UYM05700.1 D-alanine--D-alanine ligase [Solicola gregarius]
MSSESTSRRPRVAVVFGGKSSEHGVSCLTAREVMRAIDTDRYDVVPIGITREGRWVLQPGEPKVLEQGGLPELTEDGPDIAISNDPRRNEVVVRESASAPASIGSVDVVFPLLHGPWGEDGTLQGLLEIAGTRYVGAGVLASAVGMDKQYMKLVFAAEGLPQLPYVVIRPREWKDDPDAVRESIASLHYPVFVKPARAGSSFGGSLVREPAALSDAVALAQEYDPKVIVEAGAEGAREIECGVLEDLTGQARASVAGELVVAADQGHAFYDFEAKYLDGSTTLRIPADVPDDIAQRIRGHAVRAFEALGCEGLSRVDFFWLPDGRLVINELNTMPGFTPTSMFPQLWAASGLDYAALVERLIALAMARDTGLR